jgi:Mg-chelatase subunit ChlD
LFYLGEPSAPDGIHWSSRRALERADELGERGIAVWGIPIRPGEVGYLNELTRRSGGRVIPLDQLDTRFGAL